MLVKTDLKFFRKFISNYVEKRQKVYKVARFYGISYRAGPMGQEEEMILKKLK